MATPTAQHTMDVRKEHYPLDLGPTSPLPWAVVDGVIVSVPEDAIVTVTLPDGEERQHHRGMVAIVYGHHVGPEGGRTYTLAGNLAMIVRSVNAHADLRDALESLWRVHHTTSQRPGHSCHGQPRSTCDSLHCAAARAALAKAEG